jgi:hypothetical protein
VAKDRGPSRRRAIPESDFHISGQTPLRQIPFRDRASAKKHPRFRKDASERENQITAVAARIIRRGEVRSDHRSTADSDGKQFPRPELLAVPALARKSTLAAQRIAWRKIAY